MNTEGLLELIKEIQEIKERMDAMIEKIKERIPEAKVSTRTVVERP